MYYYDLNAWQSGSSEHCYHPELNLWAPPPLKALWKSGWFQIWGRVSTGGYLVIPREASAPNVMEACQKDPKACLERASADQT